MIVVGDHLDGLLVDHQNGKVQSSFHRVFLLEFSVWVSFSAYFFFLGEYSVGIFGIAVDGIIIFHVFANGSNPSN